MKISAFVSLNLVGCKRTEVLDVPDDADQEEIEEIVRDWTYDHIEWGWERDTDR